MKPILVVMAAGLGSRYGGLKQCDPLGPNGEIIIDYSVFDAKKAGFEKVVFIINKKIEKEFKEVIGSKVERVMDVEYAYQELTDIPKNITIPQERVKPWGTAHAVYSARKVIDSSPIAVINADDYYGEGAFDKIYKFLVKAKEDEFAMIGYKLKNTVTENGYVSRGICMTDECDNLIDIVERVHIEKMEDKIKYLEDEIWHELQHDQPVSMNMWGFTNSFIEEVEKGLEDYLTKGIKTNPLKCEYYLPFVVDKMIKEDKASVKVLKTNDKWYGVTYKEDKKTVMDVFKKMSEDGVYPDKLW